MKPIPEEIKKRIEEESRKAQIFEPKYGGKDRSGYDTLMKYEVNAYLDDAFENGANFGYSLANQEIERLNYIIGLKDKERQDWADLCIRKQTRIEELERLLNQ